ncbi:DinB family protein [Imperialibacter roseus]|uniref:DinB family protein n=1 Tax=Imperialibacter roseus TaxID=1324217 RepID=A0ABZ0IT81_9BACT|nr:DinB family protein [Imperialibacter roseus]WOK08233.1 DinB family protein [Imperialibacter roseus]|tara:strand:+ start:155 stop:604 length:450 start_codon:yes stop_codon:yes gene_type:complete
MSSHILISSLEFNQKKIESLLADLTVDETLAFTHDNINNIHWIVGHIASQRDTLLEDLTGEMTFPQELKQYYGKTGDPRKMPKTIDWLKCLDILKEQFNDISAWVLEWDSQGRLDREKGDVIVKYLSHEAYHIGQVSLIRKMLGKTAAK